MGYCLIREPSLGDGIRGAQWHSPLEGPDASKQSHTENWFRSRAFLRAQGKEAPTHDDGVSIGGTPNLERKLPALDPGSYLNPRKRTLEEVHGIGEIFSSDSSGKREAAGLIPQERTGGPGNERNAHAISHTSSTDPQSAGSHDDFQSLAGQSYQEESNFKPKSPIDSNARPLHNASRNARLAQRMPADDQRPVRARLQGPVAGQTIGEIVEVEGGHIVRSTARKDRHSKVYTSKGLRDRRVRLSALTAIQFYDVQDRLGFDRPSKAVDWLIKKAKASIDELARLPPCTSCQLHPNPAARFGHEAGTSANLSSSDEQRDERQLQPTEPSKDKDQATAAGAPRTDSRAIARERARERAKERVHERDAAERALVKNSDNNNAGTASLHLPRGDHHHHHQYYATNNSDSLQTSQQTASKWLPSSGGGQASFHIPLQSSGFQNYGMPDSTSRRKQDVRFSLQEPLPPFLHYSIASRFEPMPSSSAQYSAYGSRSSTGANPNVDPTAATGMGHQTGLFANSGTDQNMFGGSAVLPDHHQQELGRPHHQVLSAPWNATDLAALTPPPNLYNITAGSALNILRGHNSFTVRGTLQSISTPVCVRHSPLMENEVQTAATFASDCFSGFRIPARIQGLDEHGEIKPSDTSSSDHL